MTRYLWAQRLNLQHNLFYSCPERVMLGCADYSLLPSPLQGPRYIQPNACHQTFFDVHLQKISVICKKQRCSLAASPLCTGQVLSKESVCPKDEATIRSRSNKGCSIYSSHAPTIADVFHWTPFNCCQQRYENYMKLNYLDLAQGQKKRQDVWYILMHLSMYGG